LCFTCILILQAGAGVFACAMDWKHPFSASKAAAAYLKEHKLTQVPMAGCFDYVASAVAIRLGIAIYVPQSDRMQTFLVFDARHDALLLECGGPNDKFKDIILQRSYEYMMRKKEDILLLYHFKLGQTQYPITPLAEFTDSIVRDEIYYIYLMKYQGSASAQ